MAAAAAAALGGLCVLPSERATPRIVDHAGVTRARIKVAYPEALEVPRSNWRSILPQKGEILPLLALDALSWQGNASSSRKFDTH